MIDEIGAVIEAAGYGGVALLMLVEMVFPPIPSEIIMPVAGLSAAQGELQLWLVVLAGAAGSPSRRATSTAPAAGSAATAARPCCSAAWRRRCAA